MLYSIFYFFMFGSSFVAMQYLNLYYRQIGFNCGDISKVIIISTVFSIFSSLYLGYKFDRSNKKHCILYLILICSGVFFCSIIFLKSYVMILLFNIIFSMFYFSLQPLFTTVTLNNIKVIGKSYGVIRLFGTIGFCVTSVIIPIFKDENTIFYAMLLIISILLILFTIILKKDRINVPIKTNEKYKFKDIFKNKSINKFILYVCVINITLGAYFNFFGIYYTEQLGYSKQLYGVLSAVSTLAEIPFLLLADKIIKKYSTKNILMISGIGTGVRWLLCMFFTQPIILIVIQLLHGLGFIVLITTVNIFINNNCEKKYLGSTQSVFLIGTLVFAKVFGCIVGGMLPQYVGQRNVFLINFIICLVSVIILKLNVKENEY